MPLSRGHHPVLLALVHGHQSLAWKDLERSGQARSLEISRLRTCPCAGGCALRQWPESLMVTEPAKKLVLRGCHPVQLARLERKMDQNMLHTTIPLCVCVCCYSEGQASCWPSHGDRSGFLRPWFSTKAVSDFWVWLLTPRSRLQLLLLDFVLQDFLLLLVYHYITFYLYSQKHNTMLLFFWVECRFLGVQQMHGNPWLPWRGKFWIRSRDRW